MPEGRRSDPRVGVVEADPSIGVVVLNYRRADDTIACLTTLRRQDVAAQVIVVDNGSGDRSVDRIREAHPDISIIGNDSNLGFAAGNNVAIERLLAEGVDFVWLINNDATVEPGTLREMVDVARQDEQIGVVGSVILDVIDRERIQTWGGGSVSLRTGRTRDALGAADRLDYVTAASALYKSAALRDVGLFDERFFFLYEDVDLGVRLRQHGWSAVVAERSRVWHRGGGTSPARSAFRMEHHAAGLVLFLRKHGRWPHVQAVPMLGYYSMLAVRSRDRSILTSAWRGWRSGWTR